MFKASWMVLLTIGMLLPARGIADEATTSETDGHALQDATISIEALQAELWNASGWHDIHPVDAMAYSDNSPRPIGDFDFRETDALARVSKLRSLSLLTLAEFGQSRFFLGVNNEGLVGLHFDAFSRDDSERSLELVRMPYLKENESGNETD